VLRALCACSTCAVLPHCCAPLLLPLTSRAQCYELSCDLATGGCTPAEEAAITAYALDIQNNVTEVQATFGTRDGHFITSCWQHEEVRGSTSCVPLRTVYGADVAGASLAGCRTGCTISMLRLPHLTIPPPSTYLSTLHMTQSCRARDWYGITIDGQSANATFYTYWTQGGAAPGAKRVDGPWPSDASCAPQGFTHGAC
jgi:hypothetical protein